MSVNDCKTATIEEIQSELVDADTETLGVELTALTTACDTLLAAMSRVLSIINIIDYL